MDYRIQEIKHPSGSSVHNYYLILNNHESFVAKLYSRYDAETCLDALKSRGAPTEQTGNSRYATALAVFTEFCNSESHTLIRDFHAWCMQRLNG